LVELEAAVELASNVLLSGFFSSFFSYFGGLDGGGEAFFSSTFFSFGGSHASTQWNLPNILQKTHYKPSAIAHPCFFSSRFAGSSV